MPKKKVTITDKNFKKKTKQTKRKKKTAKTSGSNRKAFKKGDLCFFKKLCSSKIFEGTVHSVVESEECVVIFDHAEGFYTVTYDMVSHNKSNFKKK